MQRGGRELKESRVITVVEDLIQQSRGDGGLGGSVTMGVRMSWSEMSEEGWGDGPQLQWAPEEQVPGGTAAPSDHRGGAGGAAARPPESTGRQPTRLPHPWDSPGKNTGVGSLSLLQGIFPTQGLNPGAKTQREREKGD